MCGIGALLDPAGTAPADAGRADGRRAAPPRPRRRGRRAARARPRSPTPGWRSSTSPAATSRCDSEDGAITAIVNGEIYNHLELRARARGAGHRFATHSDSEVVVHGYEEYGADFVRRLNGIFALRALGRPREQRLVAARDPFGVKPLYWCTDGRRVALASEVGALLAAGLVEPRGRPGRARPLPRLPLRARARARCSRASRSCRPPPLLVAPRTTARRAIDELPRGARARR